MSHRTRPGRSAVARKLAPGTGRWLVLGTAGVLVPLTLLLWLQYRWLQDLEEASTVARGAMLDNYLEVIAQEVKYHYLGTAQELLPVSGSSVEAGDWRGIARHFSQRETELARRLFVVEFQPPPERSRVRLYDPATRSMIDGDASEAAASEEVASIRLASARWQAIYERGEPVRANSYHGEQSEPEHRMIVKQLVDEASRPVALAGMILDNDHFRATALPAAISRALPDLAEREDLRVAVHDRQGTLQFGDVDDDARMPSDGALSIERRLLFVFTDWRVSLTGPSAAPRDWARANFVFNLGLTLALSALVVGGLAILLRSTRRQLRLSQMKSDFVSNVSHQLRTPLSSIRVFGELLSSGKVEDADKIRHYGERIEAESRRLTRLVDNILDFSRLDSGGTSLDLEPLELTFVLRPILDAWQERLHHQGITLAIQSMDGQLMIEGSAEAIEQALSNLVDNAVKYSPGATRIDVRLSRRGAHAVIEVIDQGIGISRAERQYIFDRFHRVGSGDTHDVKGTGLGLALVRHIAEAHGGRVDVDSRPGEGSTFTLYLPLVASAARPVDAPHGRPSEA